MYCQHDDGRCNGPKGQFLSHIHARESFCMAKFRPWPRALRRPSAGKLTRVGRSQRRPHPVLQRCRRHSACDMYCSAGQQQIEAIRGLPGRIVRSAFSIQCHHTIVVALMRGTRFLPTQRYFDFCVPMIHLCTNKFQHADETPRASNRASPYSNLAAGRCSMRKLRLFMRKLCKSRRTISE